jgi:two-component system KDP operon response regulator KdpE
VTSRARLLVVDDDASILRALIGELEASGYETVTATDGEEALERFGQETFDLILTDLAMPRRDGFSLIAGLRGRSRVPIIVLSVRGGESDKVRALDLGADDYVTKPVAMGELLARVRTQLRRLAPTVERMRFADLTIDTARRLAVQAGREIRLTPREFAILELLARSAGRPVTNAQIVDRVWGSGHAVTPDAVRVHIASLRRKLEPNPSLPAYVVTEPWVGYRFIAEPIDEPTRTTGSGSGADR